MVINIYIDTQEGKVNGFDHPTSFERFKEENTFIHTLRSVNNLQLPAGDELSLYIFAIAVNEDLRYDRRIKAMLSEIMEESRFSYRIYTNSDIKRLKKVTKSKFFAYGGYPEIRTLGLIIPTLLQEDTIIQIDDDELLRPDYLVTLKKILDEHPDKYLITAPYEKNGTVQINTEDKLKSWPKYASMAQDIQSLMQGEELKETLFGFGGNMVIRSGLAAKSFYPLAVPRGEDFSFLLANRLIYENGNPLAGIKPKEKMFKTYFTPLKAMTIIHRPPAEAKDDFLFYLKNNLQRFIMEWSMFINQSKMTFADLRELSVYLSEMFGYEHMEAPLLEIISELNLHYEQEKVNEFSREIFAFLEKYKGVNRFRKYQEQQAEYIEAMKAWEQDKALQGLFLL